MPPHTAQLFVMKELSNEQEGTWLQSINCGTLQLPPPITGELRKGYLELFESRFDVQYPHFQT